VVTCGAATRSPLPTDEQRGAAEPIVCQVFREKRSRFDHGEEVMGKGNYWIAAVGAIVGIVIVKAIWIISFWISRS
jgi:hypothetical protein